MAKVLVASELIPLTMHPDSLFAKQSPQVSEESINTPQGTIDLEPISGKLWVFLAPLYTTVATILLVLSRMQEWYISGNVYDWVVKNRATTAAIVQVISSFLGFAQFGILRDLIVYDGRRRFARRGLRLATLNIYNAIVTASVNWSLPPVSLLLVIIVATAALAPGVVWTGALTPIGAFLHHDHGISIPTPLYTSGIVFDTAHTLAFGKPPVQTSHGLFTYNAAQDRHAYFLDDGSRAVSTDGSVPFFSKGDYSNYTYHGRSYGVGAAVGINDTDMTALSQLYNYTYSETGYQISWDCFYNNSLSSRLNSVIPAFGNRLFAFEGQNPVNNTFEGPWYVADLNNSQRIVAASVSSVSADAWKANFSAPSAYAVFIGLSDLYSSFNNIQCTAIRQPTVFDVKVDAIGRSITVALNRTVTTDELDPSGYIAKITTDIPALLSVVGTTTYTSLFGNMLNQNVFSLENAEPKLDKRTSYTRAVARVLEVVCDQQLFSSAGAQLMITRAASPADVEATTQVLRLGQDIYLWAVVGIQAALILGMVVEMARSRMWRGMPRLGFDTIADFVIAGSAGGTALAEKAQIACAAKYKSRGEDGGGRSARDFYVELSNGPLGLMLRAKREHDAMIA